MNLLNYEIYGEGKPVVFLHGFLENNFIWKKIIPNLKNVKAICVELPGHGKSPLLEEELTLTAIAKAVIKTIDSLAIERFEIVGHSMGGYTTLHIAELVPERIEKLTLLNSHPWADSDERKINRTRAVEAVKNTKTFFINEAISNLYYEKNREKLKTEIEYAIEQANKMSGEAIIQSLIAMRDREDKTSVLHEFKNRVAIIQGEFDPIVDTQKIKDLATKNGNLFHLIEGIGHNSYDEATEEVVEALRG